MTMQQTTAESVYHSGTVTYSVRLLTSLSALEELAADWRRLSAQSTAAYVWFQSYDWCMSWLRTQASPNTEPLVFALYQGSELVAVWPLMRQRKAFGLKVVTSLGHPHTQYANVLTKGGQLDQAAATTLQMALREIKDVDVVLLPLIAPHSPLLDVLPEGSKYAAFANETAIVDLSVFDTGEAFLAKAKKSTRRSRKNGLKLLASLGEVRLQVLTPSSPDYARQVRNCVGIKQQWLADTGRVSLSLGHGDHAELLIAIPEGRNGDGPHLFILMAGQTIVAYEWGVRDHGHYYSYMGSFAGEFRDAAPGKLETDLAIAWLIDKEAKTYDLLPHTTEHKRSIASSRPAVQGHAIGLTVTGNFYINLWLPILRPGLKKLFDCLPRTWRGSMASLRHRRDSKHV